MPDPTRLSALGAAVMLVITGCSVFGPDRVDYTELLAIEEPRLEQIDIADVSRADGDWVRLEGTAITAEDLWSEVDPVELADRCDGSYAGTRQVLSTGQADDRPLVVLEQTFAAGSPVVFDFEVVTAERAPGSVDSEGDVLAAAEVSSGGYTVAAFSSSFEVEGVSGIYAGQRASWFDDFDAAVIVGTPAFDVLCAEIAASPVAD